MVSGLSGLLPKDYQFPLDNIATVIYVWGVRCEEYEQEYMLLFSKLFLVVVVWWDQTLPSVVVNVILKLLCPTMKTDQPGSTTQGRV
jgi:hypothetical protein